MAPEARLVLVPRERLDDVWPRAGPALRLALRRDRDGGTLDGLRARLDAGRYVLGRLPDTWVVLEVGDFVQIIAAQGRASAENIDALLAFAREGGRRGLRCHAWGAAARLFTRMGFAEVYQVLEIAT